ncbi:MAG: flavin reductase family protein [Methylotenera sp.]|nr:flavin reductase family protein [Methylotenera sp.]MDD4927486.1 flavin reductase family protein [Methylotenera sp.]
MIKPVDLSKAYRLLNHGPTILISSSHNGKQNIMAAAWCTPLDFDPPRITVVIDKNTYTRELIEASGGFAINVPCVAQLDTVRKVGTSSGRDLADADKFALYGLETFNAQQITAPLLKGCVAWLECKVIPEPHNQNTYDLFIAEVVVAYADERVFSDGHWHFEGHDQEALDKLRTIHHVAGGAFFATGAAIQASI